MKKYLSLLFIAAMLTLSGCASPSMPVGERFTANIFETHCEPLEAVAVPVDDGLTWFPSSNVPKQKTICWERVTAPVDVGAQKQLEARCNAATDWHGDSCVMARLSTGTCWVLSTLSMDQAKVTYIRTADSHYSGLSHVSYWQHEAAHCAGDRGAYKGVAWSHTEYKIQPITWRK